MIGTRTGRARRLPMSDWASDEPDGTLVRRWQRGDLAAASIVIQRHERLVYAAALRIVREPAFAEDLSQETFLRAHERIETLRDPARFAPWVRRIGVRLAVDALRRDQPEVLSEEEPDRSSLPDEVVEVRDAVGELFARLNALPPAQRTAVILRDVEDFSISEAATLLGVSEAAFKMRLGRARTSLRARPDSPAGGKP